MSNLLDKASIILTPTAYNNGEALCVKPSDGSGDFNFSRNSAATRVNAQGLVENVQILSSNLVQNGDFSEEGVQEVSNGSFSQEGSEEITNGDFENGSTGWTLNGWTISNGKANCNGITANLIQYNVGSANKTFKLVFTISNYISGKVIPSFVGLSNESLEYNANGTYTTYISSLTDLRFVFYGNLFNGSIDNVSVREVGQDWLFAGGSEITEQGARINNTITGVNAYIRQSNSNFTIGKSFVLEYDVVATNGTTLAIEQTSSIALNTSTVGSNRKIYFQWDIASTGLVIKRLTAGTDVTITNISVKEVGQNWTLNDWSVGDSLVLSGNTSSLLQQPTIYTSITSIYKTTFRARSVSGASVSLRLYDGGGSNYETFTITSSNFQDFELTRQRAGSNSTLSLQNNLSEEIEITNISVIEITDDTNLPRINYEGFSYQDALGSEEVVNGDFATDSNWGKSSNWTISGGTANSNGLSGGIYQNIGLVSGKTYKVNVEVSLTSGSLYVREGNNGSVAETITQSGNYSIYLIGGTATSQVGYIQFYSISFTGSIDNVSVKEYLGQEVVPDSGCGSWLFEPQSTNLVTYSEEMSQYGSNVTVIDNSTKSPNGNIDASKVTKNGVSANDRIDITNIALLNNTNYSISAFIKNVNIDNGGVTTLGVRISSGGTLFRQGYVWNGDTPSLTVDYNSGTKTNVLLEDYGNGWWRIGYSFNSDGTNSDIEIDIDRDNGTDTTSVFIWGAQVEQQSYATSYIPTSGSTVTRNQDLCTNGGSLASINSTEGTLYFEGSVLANDGTNKVITLSKSSDWSNRTFLRYDATANSITYRYLVNGSIKANLTHALSDATTINKIAIKWELNNFKLYVNGLNVGQDLSGSVMAANSLDTLNFNDGLSTLPFFGKTKALAVWKEALSDAELTELTTI